MSEDKQSIGLNIVAFICPLAGFIIYFCLKNEYPVKAGKCSTWAWIGAGFYLVFKYLVVKLLP